MLLNIFLVRDELQFVDVNAYGKAGDADRLNCILNSIEQFADDSDIIGMPEHRRPSSGKRNFPHNLEELCGRMG